MKFKGFFKEYWNQVFKPSIAWMKKFWLPYSILLVVTWIISFCYVLCKYYDLNDLKSLLIKRTDEEDLDGFLK